MSKIKNGGLDQYGAGPFEQQQPGTAGVERVNYNTLHLPQGTHTTVSVRLCPAARMFDLSVKLDYKTFLLNPSHQFNFSPCNFCTVS